MKLHGCNPCKHFKMKPSKKIYISLVVFGTMLLLFIFLIFIPSFEQIKKNVDNLSFQKEMFSSLKYEKSAIKKSREAYQSLKPEIAKIDDLFLSSESPVEFLNYLEQVSKASGIGKIGISKISYLKEDNPWASFSLQISFASDFLNFSKFLESLENAPRVIQIQNLDLKKADNELSILLSLKVFVR